MVVLEGNEIKRSSSSCQLYLTWIQSCDILNSILDYKMKNSLELLPKPPALSLCMIVKNESQNLPLCLASVKPHVDEMIVVDTGSQDETIEIASQYGAVVRNFEWRDDFASARNYAISQASGDWILMIDADERLVVEAEFPLERLIYQSQTIAYLLPCTDVSDQRVRTPSYRISLFRNTPELQYKSRFHEFLNYQNQPLIANHVDCIEDVKIVHYGYCREHEIQKNISRNIPILERIWQEEGLSLMLLYCLAQMYDKTQQQDKSQICYAEAFELLLPNLIIGSPPEEFNCVPSLVYALGMQFFQQKDYEITKLLYQRGLEWCSNYPPLNYLAGVTLSTLGTPLEASVYFQKCLKLGEEHNYYKWETFDLVFITTYPAYNLGLMYIELGCAEKALAAFELALSFDSKFTLAQEKINVIKQFLSTQAQFS